MKIVIYKFAWAVLISVILCGVLTGQKTKSWRVSTVIDERSDNKGLFYQRLIFPDDKNGWLVESFGNVLQSKDGGQTWRNVIHFEDSRLASVYFVSRSQGWIVGNVVGRDQNRSCAIWTTDNAADWRLLSTIQDFRYCELQDVAFIDADNGWAVGEIEGREGRGTEAAIFVTDDGGKHWHLQFSSSQAVLFSRIKIKDGIGWVVGGGLILKSDKSAKSWQQLYQSARFNFFDIDTSSNSVWAVGSQGVLLETRDLGKSWNRRRTGRKFEKSWFSGVRFDTDRTGWIVGGFGGTGHILKTEDRGKTWREDCTVGIKGMLQDIALTPKTLVAVGSEDIILFKKR